VNKVALLRTPSHAILVIGGTGGGRAGQFTSVQRHNHSPSRRPSFVTLLGGEVVAEVGLKVGIRVGDASGFIVGVKVAVLVGQRG
jgi:uncharacterized cupin superfamily protein